MGSFCSEYASVVDDACSGRVDDELSTFFSDMKPTLREKYLGSFCCIGALIAWSYIMIVVTNIFVGDVISCFDRDLELLDSSPNIETYEFKTLTPDNPYIMQQLVWSSGKNTTKTRRIDVKACAIFDPPHSLPLGMIFSGKEKQGIQERSMAPIYSCGMDMQGIISKSNKDDLYIVLGGPHVVYTNITIQLRSTRFKDPSELHTLIDCDYSTETKLKILNGLCFIDILSVSLLGFAFIGRNGYIGHLWKLSKRKD